MDFAWSWDKRDNSTRQGTDRVLGFSVTVRLTGALARDTSGLCLTSAALPICRDDLGKDEENEARPGVSFPLGMSQAFAEMKEELANRAG